MEDHSKKRMLYVYYVEAHDGKGNVVKKRCCGKAWEFSYGVSTRTKYRASAKRGNNKHVSSSKKLANQKRREGVTSKESYAAAWLKRFAQTFGDLLPFGEHKKKPHIRVPFGNKRMVYGFTQGSIWRVKSIFF
jgi:hypothetical protein